MKMELSFNAHASPQWGFRIYRDLFGPTIYALHARTICIAFWISP